MPKINLQRCEDSNPTALPPPFEPPVTGGWQRAVGQPTHLTLLGARHVVLDPGAWSSQRHWHDGEDELLVMLSGKAVLIEDDDESELGPGEIAAWPKGVRNGHHLINRGFEPCSFVCVSAGTNTGGGYSDIDMLFTADSRYVRKDGTAY